MNRPSRLTVIAGAVGGLAITATAVAAVAMSSAAPETPVPTSPSTHTVNDVGQSDDLAPQTVPAGDEITREQAVEIAEQALADFGPVPPLDEVEREFEHGRMVWKVEFGDDHEAYVDTVTGAIIKLELDDDDDHGDDRDDDDHYDDDRDDDHYDDDDD